MMNYNDGFYCCTSKTRSSHSDNSIIGSTTMIAGREGWNVISKMEDCVEITRTDEIVDKLG